MKSKRSEIKEEFRNEAERFQAMINSKTDEEIEIALFKTLRDQVDKLRGINTTQAYWDAGGGGAPPVSGGLPTFLPILRRRRR